MKKRNEKSLRIVFAVLWILLSFFMVGPLLKQTLLGVILAAALFPYYQQVRLRMRNHSAISAILVIFVFALTVLIPFSLAVFKGIQHTSHELEEWRKNRHSSSLSQEATQFQNQLYKKIEPFLNRFEISEEKLQSWKEQALENTSRFFGLFLKNFAQTLTHFIVDVFVVLLAMFFSLTDGEFVVRKLLRNRLFSIRETSRLIRAFKGCSRGVILASFMTGFVQASILTLTYIFTFGHQYALFLFLISFFLSFVPMIGTTPVTAILTLIHFLSGNYGKGIVTLVAGLVVGISDNITRPLFLKGSFNLHPFLTFIAAFGSLVYLGPVGLFLGPVVISLFVELIEILVFRSSDSVESRS